MGTLIGDGGDGSTSGWYDILKVWISRLHRFSVSIWQVNEVVGE